MRNTDALSLLTCTGRMTFEYAAPNRMEMHVDSGDATSATSTASPWRSVLDSNIRSLSSWVCLYLYILIGLVGREFDFQF